MNGTICFANLRRAVLRAAPVADPTTSTDYYRGEYGRIRDVTVLPEQSTATCAPRRVTPDNQLWLVSNNTDGRGDPGPDDDRILSVGLGPGWRMDRSHRNGAVS